MTTTDGKGVGTVAVIVRDTSPTSAQPNSMWQLAAVKLDKAVRPSGGVTTTGVTNNMPLTVTGARSNSARVTAIADAQATGSGSDAFGLGDLGAPAVSSDGKLVAFVGTSDATLIPFTTRVLPALPQLGSGVHLLTS
ncbi:hypothetical protein [Tsukamurella pseudospumae]|uniref:hypothetical protein n=1 Tax=Tsukamurella pseudospumae TaxID=239498 RepID=UPI0011124A0C|nr:hypothetical protein [Tsukamurella pseudospumae]